MIVVVVPSNRPEKLKTFKEAWKDTFEKHNVELVCVLDGDDPVIDCGKHADLKLSHYPEWQDVIYTHNDGVRNFGFLWALKTWGKKLKIITLDDDVVPVTIQQESLCVSNHVHHLERSYPISWMSTATEYMRGFPYGLREEAECWVSHGGWVGNRDYDAPTRLINGERQATCTRMPVPKGVLIPVCGMNLAFRVEALPYVYFAPMGKKVGVHRFGDIWMGIRLKRELDKLGKCMVTGMSLVRHEQASNVFVNLEREAKGIRWNEMMWQYLDWIDDECRGSSLHYDPEMVAYAELWEEKYVKWQSIVRGLMT